MDFTPLMTRPTILKKPKQKRDYSSKRANKRSKNQDIILKPLMNKNNTFCGSKLGYFTQTFDTQQMCSLWP